MNSKVNYSFRWDLLTNSQKSLSFVRLQLYSIPPKAHLILSDSFSRVCKCDWLYLYCRSKAKELIAQDAAQTTRWWILYSIYSCITRKGWKALQAPLRLMEVDASFYSSLSLIIVAPPYILSISISISHLYFFQFTPHHKVHHEIIHN